MANVICYARVSKLDMNPENQFNDLKTKAVSLGGDFVLLEEKESTRKTRPIKESIMAYVRRQEVKVIIVWKLDRFARSTSELALNLEELKANGVRFISIRDGLDINPDANNAIQEFQYHILSAFAQLERDMIKERTLAGLERAKANGKTLGRPKGAKDKTKRRTIGYFKTV